jgi:hypothetical protein
MWILWWTEWHCDRFVSEHFGFPRHYYSTSSLCRPSCKCCCYRKDKRAKPGNFPEVMLFRKSGIIGLKSTFSVSETLKVKDSVSTYDRAHLVSVTNNNPCVLLGQSSYIRMIPYGYACGRNAHLLDVKAIDAHRIVLIIFIYLNFSTTVYRDSDTSWTTEEASSPEQRRENVVSSKACRPRPWPFQPLN